MNEDQDKVCYGEVIPPEKKSADFFASNSSRPKPKSRSASVEWPTAALIGIGAAGITFATTSFGVHEEKMQYVLAGLTGLGTTLALRDRRAAALAAGYLAYEYVAESVGYPVKYIGAVAGAVTGIYLGANLEKEHKFTAMYGIVGAAAGFVAGSVGGLFVEGMSVGIAASIGSQLKTKKAFGMAAAIVLGYFATTTAIRENILPRMDAPTQILAPR